MQSLINLILAPLGYGLFIEVMSLKVGPFSFSYVDTGTGDREAWGLGLHVVVSRLRVHPQV